MAVRENRREKKSTALIGRWGMHLIDRKTFSAFIDTHRLQLSYS